RLNDPKGMSDWLMNSELNRVPESVYEGLADRWSGADSLKASEWVATLPPGPHRNSAIKGMVSHIAKFNSEAAMTWAEAIDDISVKAEAVELINESINQQ